MQTGRFVSSVGLCAGLVLTFGATAAVLDSAAVDKRAADWQPSARERQWEQIGWTTGLKTALAQAKANNRPIFLFTHDGRLNVGRC